MRRTFTRGVPDRTRALDRVLRPDGRQVIAEYAAAGHKRDSFLLITPTPGRYLIGATVDGQRIKHSITLRLGHTVRAKLITQIR